MQKREKILLIVLAIVGVIAVVVVLVTMNPSAPPTEEDIMAELDIDGVETPSQDVEQLVTTIGSVQSVLNSDKFLMLTTFGKVPVTVNPEEMGKQNLF